MAFAANRSWTLLSYHIGHFSDLHQRWIAESKEHAGLILAAQFNPTRTLRRLFNLLFLADPKDLHSRCLFLGSWLDI